MARPGSLLIVGLALAACGCRTGISWHDVPETREVAFRITYRFTCGEQTEKLRVVALVPRSLPGWQEVSDVSFSYPPLKVTDVGDNRYAEFLFPRPSREVTIVMSGRARLLRRDLSLARGGGGESLPDPKPFLLDEPNIEADHPEVQAAAQAVAGETDLDVVRGIYALIVEGFEYELDLSSTTRGALHALHARKGDCTDYSDVMVALCRARGIPARHVLGLYADPKADDYRHSWVEIHLPGLGWVPFDPTVDLCTGNATFERLKPNYLVFSTVRNDELLDNYAAYAMYRWWGERVQLHDTYEVTAIKEAGR